MNKLLILLLLFSALNATSQCITSYPYTESFETGTANWQSGGTNNDWTWGSPAKPVINSAGAGVNCWITGGTVASFYNLGERSWVESPCFDFTGVVKPYISFLIFWETERTYDGGNLQYSISGGSWVTLGSVNETDTCTTKNWYNTSNITNLGPVAGTPQGWSGTISPTSGSCNGGNGSGGWKRASHCLVFLAGEPSVRFRFSFGSGTACNNFDGIAFDDIYIGESPAISADFIYTCIGHNEIRFEDTYRNCYGSRTWNFDDPLSSDNTSSAAIADHLFSQGGTYDITLQVSGGCSQDTQVTKQIKLLSFNTQSTDVSCFGLNDGTASAVASGGTGSYIYSWSHDPSLNSSLATGLSAGAYSLTIKDGFCDAIANFEIQYGPLANPTVELGDDTTICPGSKIILKAAGFNSYKWQDNTTDSFYVVSKNGIYSLNVRNSAGCNASDSIVIEEDCMNDIVVPNAFTPNGDGINEIFFVNGSKTTEFELFVFNRWGEMIFRSPDREIGWDGTAKGNPVQEGFYNYLINYSLGEDELVKSGSVLVIR